MMMMMIGFPLMQSAYMLGSRRSSETVGRGGQ